MRSRARSNPIGPGSWSLFGRAKPPRGLYIWGDVGRGKSMLMDMFFDKTPIARKRRVHFNAFMQEVHARIHEWRNLDAKARAKRPEFVREAGDDPIAPVAHAVANDATLLCFDEFQVTDVADAMILGRLFEQLFQRGVVIVATSNTAPARLYEGGLNRQLFLPFIAMIEQHLDVVEINGPQDYRLLRMKGVNCYITPLGPDADRAMNESWLRLTGKEKERRAASDFSAANSSCRKQRAGSPVFHSRTSVRSRWVPPTISRSRAISRPCSSTISRRWVRRCATRRAASFF